MGIMKVTQGLILYDDFSTDTSANYDTFVGSLSVSSGKLVGNSDNCPVLHKLGYGAKCVTIRMLGTTDGGCGVWLFATPSANIDAAADCDGYRARPQTLGNGLSQVYEMVDNVGSGGYATGDTYYLGDVYARIYRQDSSTVVGRAGNTNIADDSVLTDSSYPGPYYGGHWFRHAADQLDWIDIRIGHTVVVKSLPTGYYAKVSDGTTTAKAVESGGTATVNAGAVLFPLSSVQVYNGDPDSGGILMAELTSAQLGDMGGGDEYTYSSSLLSTVQLRLR